MKKIKWIIRLRSVEAPANLVSQSTYIAHITIHERPLYPFEQDSHVLGIFQNLERYNSDKSSGN